MPILDHFNVIAPLYDRFLGYTQPDKLIELASLPTPGTLLDAGGGTGRISESLKNHIDKTIVADLSIGMLKQAAQKDQLLPLCACTENLPFPAEMFERIIIVDAIHHVYNAQETCSELFRVLKPGGILVIEEPDIRTLVVKLVAVIEKLALMRSRFISPPKIASFFNSAEGKVKEIRSGYTTWIVVEKPNGAAVL